LKSYQNLLLATIIAPVVAWSAWNPFDRLTWWLEVMPVFMAFVALFIAQANHWRFSNLSIFLIGLHMIVLLVGGHYTYALVPLGDRVSEMLDFKRNHYDRLGHLMQGIVPAILCREIFIRNGVLSRRGWLGFCVMSFCLALSATYELIEWLTALISAEASASFLGTQGDVWDTQWDMFLAGVGALFSLVFISPYHDRSMAKLNSSNGSENI
jgi:putative membrane protein